MNNSVVIVGAGQAGLQVAVSLRTGGFQGGIVLIGKEPHLPYQRPPLSKQVLKGEWPAAKCLLRHAAYFAEHAIGLRLATTAARLDAAAGRVWLESGESVAYDQLVICTGSRLNRLHLAGSGLGGVHYLRTIDQALALREALRPGCRLVVAGGGYIGLEVAASARFLGCEVAVVEPLDQLMKRSALPPVAAFLQQRHLAAGVQLHLGRSLTGILGQEKVEGVQLDDGQTLSADLVLKGIGVRPDLRWLEDSGIETGRGVRVDERCRTNVENVWAAGDVCESRHPLLAHHMVLESVQNAVSQGQIAAAGILGKHLSYTETPWFWSDQYDCRLQMAGVPREGDTLVIRASGPNSISVLGIGADGLHAIQCINAPRDYMAARKLIERGENSAALFEPTTNLKDLL